MTTPSPDLAYDNLLMIQQDFSVKPELATSWEANADLSSYTFHLRQGVKFYPVGSYPGKDFKAEDVIFTFNRLMDPVLDSPARPTFTSTIEDIGRCRRLHRPLRLDRSQLLLPGHPIDLPSANPPRRCTRGPADPGRCSARGPS